MAYADLYEIRDRQTYTDQQVLNVYHAERLSGGFGATQVGQSFIDSVMPDVLNIQPSQLTHDLIEVQSISEPTDFASLTFSPNVGLLTGQSNSSFMAAAIQFNRLRTDMKHGQKRWVAGSETEASGNDWITSFVTLLTTLANAVIANWEETANPGVPVARFTIVKRVCKTFDAGGKCLVYELPQVLDDYVNYFPTTFIVRDTIRSQVSRKRLV